MYVQIQTVDGQFFASDPFDVVSSGLLPAQFEEAVSAIVAQFQNWREANFICLEIGGRERFFNPVNVLWAELVE